MATRPSIPVNGDARRLLKRWQEIADFFGKDVRTVKRWAVSRGLPIHRVRGVKRSAVYADAAELESWLKRGVNESPNNAFSDVAAQAFQDGGASPSKLFENAPPRDLAFTGRAHGLAALRASLHDPAHPAAGRHVVIHGLGGIGKSTMATEYLYQYADDYAGIWWAHASQRPLLVESLAALGARLDPRFAVSPDQEKAAAAAVARLPSYAKPLLLIYDDVESPDAVRDLIPSTGAHVIITSRWADWSGRAEPLRLDIFDQAIAVEFLQKRAGRNDPEGAKRLAAALGGLPLALDHAGAYCRLTASSFDSYLQHIDARIARAPKGVAYPTSIAATFGLAIEAATKQHAAAATLLGALAYLAPDKIPLTLAAATIPDEEDRADAVAALYAVSLIEHVNDDGETMLMVHPLVQAAMRSKLADHGEAQATLDRITAQLARKFPAAATTEPKTWSTCGALLPHVLALRRFAGWSASAKQEASQLLHSVGVYLYVRSSFQEAEQFLREAIAISEKTPGGEYPELSRQRFDLGRVLFITGRLSEAEALFRQAIIDGERTLGRNHLEVAVRRGLLAEVLSHTKRNAEAEILFRDIIAIADRHADNESLFDVKWRNDLGVHLDESGQYGAAEAIYREALAIGAKKLGRRHPEIARGLNNLGRALRDMGRYEEAESPVREAIEIWRSVLGVADVYLARGQHNLAYILLRLDRPDEALELAEAALSVHERALGDAHFWTIDSARRCVEAHAAIGDARAAAALRNRFKLLDQERSPTLARF